MDFKNFLNNSSLNYSLKPVTHDEVWKLISQLNNQKALGTTSILVTILKDNIDVLVRPLTLILNQSFDRCIFLKIFKFFSCWFTKKKTLSLLATTALYLYYLYLAKSSKKLCIIEFILFSVNIDWSIQISLVFVQITQLNTHLSV